MQYFEKQNLAFFHIPKTGGISFREFLRNQLGQWYQYQEKTNHELMSIKKEVVGEELFNKINIVTNIRNPYTNLVSYFNSLYTPALGITLNGKLNPKTAKKSPQLIDVYGLPFEGFVDWYVNTQKSYDEQLFIDGKLPDNVNILRLENIKEDANRVLNKKLNLNLDVNRLQRLNRSNRSKPLMDYHTKDTLDKITKKQKWTFDMGFYNIKEN